MSMEKNCCCRKAVEKLKSDWMLDPCWDLSATEGFEAYRDELRLFQKEYEAESAERAESERQDEHKRLAGLFCPLASHIDCACCLDKCAWWCEWDNACALKVLAKRLR